MNNKMEFLGKGKRGKVYLEKDTATKFSQEFRIKKENLLINVSVYLRFVFPIDICLWVTHNATKR